MRVGKHRIGVWVVGSALLISALGLAGCLGPLIGRSARKGPPAFDQADALILAKLEAKSKGVLIDPYRISAREKGPDWLVRFERTAPRGLGWWTRRKWPYRFDVLVASSGEVSLLRQ